MINIFKECYRVLKKNGSLYFFHNDFKQICELQIAIEKETNFIHQRFITLTKDSYILKLYPNSKSFINCCEYLLIYIKDEMHESRQIDYFKMLHKKIGLSKSQIKKDIPLADHAFRVSKNNFSLPTEETYKKIIDKYNLKDTIPLSELKTYKELSYIYNGKAQPNYLHYNFNKKITKHPCEKPQELLLNLIRTGTNEGDIVLDCFMGCGSTGLACKKLNRKFIGIEKDEIYFKNNICKCALKK
jgi:DNA modification methylase